jgi:hypothetical protein
MIAPAEKMRRRWHRGAAVRSTPHGCQLDNWSHISMADDAKKYNDHSFTIDEKKGIVKKTKIQSILLFDFIRHVLIVRIVHIF